MTISLTTLNLRNALAIKDGRHHWWFRRYAALRAATLRSADFVCCQEALGIQTSFLVRRMPHYSCAAQGRNANGHGEACPIFVRTGHTVLDWGIRWFSDTPGVAGSKWAEASLPRIVTLASMIDDVSGFNFTVANLHIDATNAHLRRRSLALLRGWAEESTQPWVITGDFNCFIDADEMSELLDHGWSDALAPAPSTGPGLSTFHGFTGSPDGPRIDHVLVPKEMFAKGWTIDNTATDTLPSDHWAVTVELDHN